jgi:hypothetical protein
MASASLGFAIEGPPTPGMLLVGANLSRRTLQKFASLAYAMSLAALPFHVDAQIDKPSTDWLDPVVIDAGKPELRLEKAGRISIVDAAIAVRAPLQQIWDVLVACDVAPEYVPNVEACQSIDTLDDGRSELFIQTVKPAFFIPSFEHVFRMDYTPLGKIDIRRVSGPIKLLDATWWLDERDDGTVLLLYHLELDPGIPIPRLFVRATLRRDLPVVLEAVKQRAEAGVDP